MTKRPRNIAAPSSVKYKRKASINPMKKISSIFIILLALAILGTTLGFAWWNIAKKPPSQNEEVERFLITKGASAQVIANNLEAQGFIKSALAYKVYVQTKGITKKIPPGEFRISQNLSLSEVVDLLLKGPTELWVTLPEGLRREQVVERFLEVLELEGSQALAFRTEFLDETENLEGYLFPDTYLFPPDVTPSAVVEKLTATFNSKFTNNSSLTDKQVVILASIIERETIADAERPIVAGIYLNRINAGMPLQADATAQYAIGQPGAWWPKSLTRQDLEVNSPFNTYIVQGLPPSSIASPGLSSLNAAANPATTDFVYYIHDEEGTIHYAETLPQHNANVQKYLR